MRGFTAQQPGSATPALLIEPRPPLPRPQVELCLAASKLENKDTWSKSDPFLRISKARENGDWAPVLKTEVRLDGVCTAERGRAADQPCHLGTPGRTQTIQNNLNPTWRPIKVAMSQLCSCDEQRPLLLEVRVPQQLSARRRPGRGTLAPPVAPPPALPAPPTHGPTAPAAR